MRVIVINTGTELLLGQVLNTHLAFIAREIAALGLRVNRQMTVPDGGAILTALRETLPQADIVFVTGGLGPTTDDITREAAAELLGRPMERDPEVAADITERLRTRGFPMTERILRQAEAPQGAAMLPNANGTAPGLYLAARQDGDRQTPHLFLLPGPPRELQPMFRDHVLPILRHLHREKTFAGCRTFRLACVGESMVEAAIGAKLLALPGVELGYCARFGEVDVRLMADAATLDLAGEIIRTAFPDALYTTDDENLEEVIVRLLASRGETIATAESCTGGYIAHRLTNVPGASAVFLAAYVPYANEAKVAALSVNRALIEEHGAVSEEVARAMAEGALRNAGATYALATTGIAGPGGGTPGKPVGTVFIALASSSAGTLVKRRRFQMDRETFKQLASQTALDILRRRLISQ